MKNKYLAFRFKTFAKLTISRGAIGFTSAFAAIEILVFLIPALDPVKFPSMVALAGGLVLVAIIRGIAAQSRLSSMRFSVGPGHDVRVVVNDFMENLKSFPGASCVFGVNDEYSVKGLKGDSIHEHFLRSYFSQLTEEDCQEITDGALALSVGEPLDSTSAGTTVRKQYPYGTVVCLPFDEDATRDRYAFLLANSSRRKHGFNGNGGTSNFLPMVWEYHVDKGLVSSELLFALVGTGHSNDMSKTRSLVRIVDEYFESLQAGFESTRIKRLILSVPEGTVMNGEINLEALHLYIGSKIAVHREMV